MNQKVKNFIEEYANLIDDKDFKSLYLKSYERLNLSTGGLTEVFLSVDIDPLDYLTRIPAFYLYGIHSVDKIIIPDGIISIGDSAFENCENLTSISIPDSINSIGDSVFSGCRNLMSLKIPNGVASIDFNTFDGCSSLTNIAIPDSVTSIRDFAFRACSSLTSITIPNSVIKIGNYAFADCQNLSSIFIPENITLIEYLSFEGCDNLTEIVWNAKNCKIEPSGAKGGNWLNLTSAIIGQSVQVIPTNLFKNCSKLTTIRFVGTKNQWKSLLKRPGWRKGSSIKTIHCVDGDIEVIQQ